MSNEEWQEMIRKNVAEHTVLSPAHIMYYPQVEGITPTVISDKEENKEED